MITPILLETSGEQLMNNFDAEGDYKINWSIDKSADE
jgi:hypothetical protein